MDGVEETPEALYRHPKLGSSWEGFALDCVWRSIGKSDEQADFWATYSGAEVDLFWQHDGKHWAGEFQFASAPTLTKSMLSALSTFNLEKLWVIYNLNNCIMADLPYLRRTHELTESKIYLGRLVVQRAPRANHQAAIDSFDKAFNRNDGHQHHSDGTWIGDYPL
ncbi:MAG: hypothetical protein ABFS56_35565 [Pseudomonadota bacterium]